MNPTSILVPVSAWYTRWPPPLRSRPSLSPSGPSPPRTRSGKPGTLMLMSRKPRDANDSATINRIKIVSWTLRLRINYSFRFGPPQAEASRDTKRHEGLNL